MKFNKVSIHISNVDEDNAKVWIEFDPALPADAEDVEDQPALTLLETMLDAIREEHDESSEVMLQ